MGRSLKKIRERKAMSIQEVLNELRKRFRISFSSSSFSRMELGRSYPKANIVAALCVIYNVRLESVMLNNDYDYQPESDPY